MADMQEHPLVPPELLQYTLLRETSQPDHDSQDATSLLRFLSIPGHHYGEGYRRIFIGHHPDDNFEYVGPPSDVNPPNDDGGRSFLVGVETLWELHAREQRKSLKGKQRESVSPPPHSPHPVGNGHAIHPPSTSSNSRHSPGPSTTSTISDDHIQVCHADTSDSDDEDETVATSPPTTASKRRLRAFPWSRKKALSIDTKATSNFESKRKEKHSSSSSPDDLLKKLSSKDARKKLSSGVSETTHQLYSDNAVEHDSSSIPQDVLSRRALNSPKAIDGASSMAIFHDAASFLTEGGKRTTGKEVSDDVKALVRNSVIAPQNEPKSAARHELLRQVSETLLPDTASDTFVVTSNKNKLGDDIQSHQGHAGRPLAQRLKSTKSVTWDMSNGNHAVPRPRGKSMHALASGSGDQPASDPSQVLSRPEPLEQPAERVPDNIPPMAQLARVESSDSVRELTRLAGVKEASLPPGSEKLERMIIRTSWTKQETFPLDFDELAARKLSLNWKPWEEMAVVWKKHHLEIYATHVRKSFAVNIDDMRDPYNRFLTRKLALKFIIPLTRRSGTALSVYSVADQIFCLRCPPSPLGGRHFTGKAGTTNKRHVNSAGTNLFLFRARATSIAQDWYLGLHLALEKEKIDKLEVYLAALGVRIRLPTHVPALPSASLDAVASATRKLMSAGLPDRNLVSKEEMIQSCTDLISNRQDWKELLESMQRKGISLRLAWRKGLVLDWLSIDRSVDGMRRIWDVYTGAIMKQANEPVHRLEVLVEKHYPTFVTISPGVHNVEPPAIEGYISRLRHRNENQRERLYLGTTGGSLIIYKGSRAKLPSFPNIGEAHREEEHEDYKDAFQEICSTTANNAQPPLVKAQLEAENKRLSTMLVRCKGLIRLRDVISVELDDSCEHCRGKDSALSKKFAKGSTHEHIIVQLNLSNDRQFRFETTPKEAAREWVGRVSSLVEYWTAREKGDAQVQLSLSSYHCSKQYLQSAQEAMPPFQKRELENASTGTDVYEPLLSQAFNYCVQNGCRNHVLMQGRLYHKKGHRDAFFLDRYIVLLDNNLIIYETYRRNFSKRPVPLVYHRRLKTLRLRDIYVVTGESCLQYFRKTGQNDFSTSSSQSAFARIYKDGLVAVDDPMDCTFMLWSQKPSGTMTKLGRNGEVNVFRARSRLERDQWVQAFNVMCEAYGRTTREREVRLATFSQIS